MREEVSAAVTYLGHFIPDENGQRARFMHHLADHGHWHPNDSERGSAYRAINRQGGDVDKLILLAAQDAMIPHAAISAWLLKSDDIYTQEPREPGSFWTMWIDPGSVTMNVQRAQSEDLFYTLYALPNIHVTSSFLDGQASQPAENKNILKTPAFGPMNKGLGLELCRGPYKHSSLTPTPQEANCLAGSPQPLKSTWNSRDVWEEGDLAQDIMPHSRSNAMSRVSSEDQAHVILDSPHWIKNDVWAGAEETEEDAHVEKPPALLWPDFHKKSRQPVNSSVSETGDVFSPTLSTPLLSTGTMSNTSVFSNFSSPRLDSPNLASDCFEHEKKWHADPPKPANVLSGLGLTNDGVPCVPPTPSLIVNETHSQTERLPPPTPNFSTLYCSPSMAHYSPSTLMHPYKASPILSPGMRCRLDAPSPHMSPYYYPIPSQARDQKQPEGPLVRRPSHLGSHYQPESAGKLQAEPHARARRANGATDLPNSRPKSMKENLVEHHGGKVGVLGGGVLLGRSPRVRKTQQTRS